MLFARWKTDSDSSGSYETVEDIISFMMMGVGVIYFMLVREPLLHSRHESRQRLLTVTPPWARRLSACDPMSWFVE